MINWLSVLLTLLVFQPAFAGQVSIIEEGKVVFIENGRALTSTQGKVTEIQLPPAVNAKDLTTLTVYGSWPTLTVTYAFILGTDGTIYMKSVENNGALESFRLPQGVKTEALFSNRGGRGTAVSFLGSDGFIYSYFSQSGGFSKTEQKISRPTQTVAGRPGIIGFIDKNGNAYLKLMASKETKIPLPEGVRGKSIEVFAFEDGSSLKPLEVSLYIVGSDGHIYRARQKISLFNAHVYGDKVESKGFKISRVTTKKSEGLPFETFVRNHTITVTALGSDHKIYTENNRQMKPLVDSPIAKNTCEANMIAAQQNEDL
jgi:hypothetical protein